MRLCEVRGEETNHMTMCDFRHLRGEQCGTTFSTMSNHVEKQCQTMSNVDCGTPFRTFSLDPGLGVISVSLVLNGQSESRRLDTTNTM